MTFDVGVNVIVVAVKHPRYGLTGEVHAFNAWLDRPYTVRFADGSGARFFEDQLIEKNWPAGTGIRTRTTAPHG